MSQHIISITDYTNAERPELLRLLLELHSTYFQENAPTQLQELKQELNIRRTFDRYIDLIEQSEDALWQIYLAKTETDHVIGFIIGSIKTDEYLLLNKIGILEDWYVEPSFRNQGIGFKLYDKLEQWFKGKSCHQIQSDTWEGNELSLRAHKQAGFFISGIKLSKKI